MRRKNAFPSPLFYVKVGGGHKRLFELWSGIETVYWFATLWRDDCIAKTSEIEYRWQPKTGLNILLRMETSSRESEGSSMRGKKKKNQTHSCTQMWTYMHTSPISVTANVRQARWTNRYPQMYVCMRVQMYSFSHCLFVYAWLSSTTIFHSSFVPLLVYSNTVQEQKKKKISA